MQTDSSLSLTATVAGQVPKPTLQSQLGNRANQHFKMLVKYLEVEVYDISASQVPQLTL